LLAALSVTIRGKNQQTTIAQRNQVGDVDEMMKVNVGGVWPPGSQDLPIEHSNKTIHKSGVNSIIF
jgi:hypothetical protein